MRVSEIKEICEDFEPIRDSDGLVKCQFFRDEMCSLPGEFLCKFIEEIKRRGDADFEASKKAEKISKAPATSPPANSPAFVSFDGKKTDKKAFSTPVEMNRTNRSSFSDTHDVPHTRGDKSDKPEFVFSHSRIGTFKQCPFKYFLKYILELPLEVTPAWAILGRAYHKAIETAYRTHGEKFDFDTTGDNYEDAKIRAVVEGALGSLYEEGEYEVENHFKMEVKDFFIRGYIDIYDIANARIIEHKTSGNAGAFNLLNVIYQFAMYLQAKPDTRLYKVNVIQKPRHKPKKTETPEEFGARILKEIKAAPAKYLKTIDFHASEIDVQKYFKEQVSVMEHIMACHQSGMFVRNPSACMTMACEYGKPCLTKL